MTTSSLAQNRLVIRIALGFLVGIAIIPVTILLARPHAEEVGDVAFNRSPREARFHLLDEVSSSDRYDELVLVGSSVVHSGFEPRPGDRYERFGLMGMRVGETKRFVSNLLERPRPPKLIIVDWSALHDIPHELLPNQKEALTYFSLDYLRFALAFRALDRGNPERSGKSTWANPQRTAKFRKGNLDNQIGFGLRFAEYSKLPEFLSDLDAMCDGAETRFVIVRFPVFYKINEEKLVDYIKRVGAVDYRSVLERSQCDVEFVDLLTESLNKDFPYSALQNDQDQWSNVNHFKPPLGAALLDDPRLGGPGKLTRDEPAVGE